MCIQTHCTAGLVQITIPRIVLESSNEQSIPTRQPPLCLRHPFIHATKFLQLHYIPSVAWPLCFILVEEMTTRGKISKSPLTSFVISHLLT